MSSFSASRTLVCAAGLCFACAEEPAELDDVDGDLAPDVLRDGAAAVVVPPPSSGVVSELIYADGSTRILHAETRADGEVTVIDQDVWDPPSDSHAACARPAACQDGAYSHMGHRWAAAYEWWFNGSSTPSEITATAAELQLRSAASNITRSDNSCGYADLVSATATYRGRTTRVANISAGGACGDRDSHNVIAFGDLPLGVLGVACTWYAGGLATESDVKLNKVDYRWFTGSVPSGCSKRFSLQAVATHELGHTFGLGHVSECSHGALTMSTKITACSTSATTLGRGDVRGLRALY